jgi:hypothetical protein
MKYVVSLIFGLSLGAVTALAGIYFNPLTRGQSGVGDGFAWRLDYELAPSQSWLFTHDDRLDLPVVPADAPLLFEQGIRSTLLAAMPLRDGEGLTNAAATRISVPSAETEFLRSGLVVEDHWLISVPGRGTLYVHSLNNQWPLLRDTVVRVDWLRRQFSAGSYDPTRGPAAEGAEVVGLTGSFGGARGHAHERLTLASYHGSLETLTGQLMIDIGEGG